MGVVGTGFGGVAISVDVYIDFMPNPNGSATTWDVVAGYNTSSMLCPDYGTRKDPPPLLPGNRTACPAKMAPLTLKASTTGHTTSLIARSLRDSRHVN